MGTLVFQATLGGAVNIIGPNIANTINFTLPSADGTSGQTWTTNGSGVLAFGTLGIAGGGTGQTTATAAFNALAPSQSGQSGKYLTTDGTNTSWGTNPLGTVTSVGGTGTVNGITLTGTVTTSGNLTLGGTLSGVSLTTQVTGILPTANGGTNLGGATPFTSGGVVYASSSSALATGSALQFDGSQLGIGVTPTAALDVLGSFLNGGSSRTNGATKTFGFRLPHFSTATNPINVIGGLSTTGLNYVYIGGSDSNIGGTAATDLFFYTAANNTTANGTLRYTIDSAGTSIWSVGGSEGMRLTSTGLGIGTSSPSGKLHVAGTGTVTGLINSTNGGTANLSLLSSGVYQWTMSADTSFRWSIDGSEKARIDAGGNFLVGTTTDGAGIGNTATGVKAGGNYISSSRASNSAAFFNRNTDDGSLLWFGREGNNVGSISVTTLLTAYNTTSDYRLKTIIGVVTGHGERLDALEPIEYTWNSNGLRTRGFLAHKFQEVYADSVTGAKDAVDADGKPVYQQMQASTSEVIADLVAEIQSLRQRVAQLETN